MQGTWGQAGNGSKHSHLKRMGTVLSAYKEPGDTKCLKSSEMLPI